MTSTEDMISTPEKNVYPVTESDHQPTRSTRPHPGIIDRLDRIGYAG